MLWRKSFIKNIKSVSPLFWYLGLTGALLYLAGALKTTMDGRTKIRLLILGFNQIQLQISHMIFSRICVFKISWIPPLFRSKKRLIYHNSLCIACHASFLFVHIIISGSISPNTKSWKINFTVMKLILNPFHNWNHR